MAAIDLSRAVAPPPLGVIPNFANPPNQSKLAYSTTITALVLLTFFVWFRAFVKLCIVKKTHVEDYLMPLAWLAAVGHITLGLIVYEFAPIIHGWDMQLHTFGDYLLHFRIGAIFYNISMLLIKIAMLVQIRRVFIPRGIRSKTYYVVHILIWMNVLYYIGAMCSLIFLCRPIEKAWKPWVGGKCYKVGNIATATAIMNVVSDLAILLLTQNIIWNLMKVDWKKRMRLCVVFLAGLVPCGFAGLCLYYNYCMSHSTDFVHDLALMSIACYGEMSSATFVLFLPILPRFFSWVRDCSVSSSKNSRASSPLDFADAGVPSEEDKRKSDKSLWHISYTQKGGDDEQNNENWKEEKAEDYPSEERSVSSISVESIDAASVSPIFSKKNEAVWKVRQ